MRLWASSTTRWFSRLVNDHPRVWTRAEKAQLQQSLHNALGDLPQAPRHQVIDVSFDQMPLQRQLELLAESPPPDAHRDPEVMTLLNRVQNERWARHPRILHAAGKLVLSFQRPELHDYVIRIYEALLSHIRLLSTAERQNVFMLLPPRLLEDALDVWAEQLDEEDEIVAFCRVLGARGTVPSTFRFEHAAWSTYRRESLLDVFLSLARAKMYDIALFNTLVEQLLVRYRFMTSDEKQQVFLTLGLYKRAFDSTVVLPHPMYLSSAKQLKQQLSLDFHESLPMLTMKDAVLPLVACVDLHLNTKRTFKIVRNKLMRSHLMQLDKPEHFSSLMYAFRRISSSVSPNPCESLAANFTASFMRWLPLMDAKMIYTTLEALASYCNKKATYVFFEAFVRLCEFLEADHTRLTTAELLHVLSLYRTMPAIRKVKCLWPRLLPLAEPHLSAMSTPQLTTLLVCVHMAAPTMSNLSLAQNVFDALTVRLDTSGSLIAPWNVAKVWLALAEVNVRHVALMNMLAECVQSWFDEQEDGQSRRPPGLTPQICVNTLLGATALDVDAVWMPRLIQECIREDVVGHLVESPALASTLIDALLDAPGGDLALAELERCEGDDGFANLRQELMLMIQARRAKERKHASRAVFTLGDVLGKLPVCHALAHAPLHNDDDEDGLVQQEQLRSSGGFEMQYTDYYSLPWAHSVYRIGIILLPDDNVQPTAAQRLQWRYWQRRNWRIIGVYASDLEALVDKQDHVHQNINDVLSKRNIAAVATLTPEEVRSAGDDPSEFLRDKAVADLSSQVARMLRRVVGDDKMRRWALGGSREQREYVGARAPGNRTQKASGVGMRTLRK
eukprot:GEMP01018104.1.p1 GENE.GEMP01018104.1~~GEMP01018104.1.p1  ORF type:complete len:843 (+),score=205.88 GEMP01018104.1:81-2609(+)